MTERDSEHNKPLLESEFMIGFCGSVKSGLKVTPDGRHMIYPVGCTVVIEDIQSKKQDTLTGHTNNVSCIAVSKTGRYVASGQVTPMGFLADIIIWDFETKNKYCTLTLHRNKVEALAFSPNDKYLVSLGGQDDGSIVVWNIETKESICGSIAQVMSAGRTHTVAYLNNTDNMFATGGEGTLRLWTLEVQQRKVRPHDVNVGQIKRVINCIEVDENDEFFYCGTTTGDIMKVNIKSNNFQKHFPEKDLFSLGITALAFLQDKWIVGSGDGTVCVVGKNLKRSKEQCIQVVGAVTSIALRGRGHQIFIGTDQCNIYRLSQPSFKFELVSTCHYDVIYDLAFPFGSPNIAVTCSRHDIRTWDMVRGQELVRIKVPNMTCNTLAIMKDGKSIISGWDDGRIRAFFPESGKPMYRMEKGYGSSITALATFNDCTKIVSGSNLGHVVVWEVPSMVNKNKGPINADKHCLLKEHQAAVTCIKISRNDKECVTSSIDGSCIIWDLIKLRRRQMIRVNTLFKYVCFSSDENQVITTGTDRKIGYWDTYDASILREVDGSLNGSVNCMDISTNGKFFVSGGDDKLIKLWSYDDAEPLYIGIRHSAPVMAIKISPGDKFIVSVSADGCILKWKFPESQQFQDSQQQVC